MVGKIPKTHQLDFFQTPLVNFIDMNHELVQLAHNIDWESVEHDFSGYFSERGRPSVPVRKMVGLLLLKSLYNLSDERVVAQWRENPYFQYFTGEKVFQKGYPFDPSDFVHFRKRIGKEGAEKLLSLSIRLNLEEDGKIKRSKVKEVIVDTTVQEKNITYPTDGKLYKKVIKQCKEIAEREGVVLRRTYTRELKSLSLKMRFMNHPKRKKEGRKALRRLRTIAKAQVNDLVRKLPPEQRKPYEELLLRFCAVITQERNDKNKIYSLHEPDVVCISKGKEGKPYEFGNKSSIAKTVCGLVVGAMAFEGNPYDGHTLPVQLEQIKRLTGHRPKFAFVDRGYRGKTSVESTKVEIPGPGKKGQSYYLKQKARRKFRQRAGIEPVIGHLKRDHRMLRNYLKGTAGDAINTMMAAAGYNLRHWIIQWKAEVFFVLFWIFRRWAPEVSLFRRMDRRLVLQPVPGIVGKQGFYKG
ncbi:MAG: IS5 family transposase [Bacteroidales bacterium]|jgi:IS5 family transposase